MNYLLNFIKLIAIFVIVFVAIEKTNAEETSWIIGDKNYTLPTTNEMSWLKAYKACSSIGMRLPSPKSTDDQREFEIAQLMARLEETHTWTSGIHLNEWVWSTADYSKFGYTNWSNGYPSVNEFVNSCAFIGKVDDGFKWQNADCEETHAVICVKSIE